MANWNLPTLSDLYANFRQYISDRLDDSAKMFNSATVTATNLPTGTVRWNSTSSKFEIWSGSAWGNLAAAYGISVSGSSASCTGNAATATTAATCTGNAATAAACTGNAATATTCTGNAATATSAAALSGSAANSLAKAWCVFTGTLTGTNAPLAGYNVTSVTRNANGDYTINIATALSSVNFALTGSSSRNGVDAYYPVVVKNLSRTTTTSSVQVMNKVSTGTLEDAGMVSIAIFGG